MNVQPLDYASGPSGADGGMSAVVTDVVRRFAKQTTPEEMQARGVRTVRSVSLPQVANLIENAIQTALMQRHLGVVEDDQQAFAEAAREEFVRLIEGGKPQTVAPEAGSALSRLKSQLRDRRESLAADRNSLLGQDGQAGATDDRLQDDLRSVFVNWGGDSGRLSPLEQEITEVALLALRRERGRGAQADLERRASEIDLLERRVSKLSGELTNTEAELARVLASKDIDHGLKSEYSEVQGLSDGDGQFERKSELMTALFAANIELRAKLDSEELEAVEADVAAEGVTSEESLPQVDIPRPKGVVTPPPLPVAAMTPAAEPAHDRDWSSLWSRDRANAAMDQVAEPVRPRFPDPAPMSDASPSDTQSAPVEETKRETKPETPAYVSAPSWLAVH